MATQLLGRLVLVLFILADALAIGVATLSALVGDYPSVGLCVAVVLVIASGWGDVARMASCSR